jgi:hypothetical protein
MLFGDALGTQLPYRRRFVRGHRVLRRKDGAPLPLRPIRHALVSLTMPERFRIALHALLIGVVVRALVAVHRRPHGRHFPAHLGEFA